MFSDLIGVIITSSKLESVLLCVAVYLFACLITQAQDKPTQKLLEDYISRLKVQVRFADSAALRGANFVANGNLESGLEEYSRSIDLLPSGAVTTARRELYTKKYAETALLLAQGYTKEKRYTEALKLTEAILLAHIRPNSEDAKKLRKTLIDQKKYGVAEKNLPLRLDSMEGGRSETGLEYLLDSIPIPKGETK